MNSNETSCSADQAGTSRRDFVRTTAAAALAGPLATLTASARTAAASSTIPGFFGGKPAEIGIGVVGTGGRGTGACHDNLYSSEGVKLVAMGDLDASICARARQNLLNSEPVANKVQVSDDSMFGGLDAYEKVIHHPQVDVVILTTPPGFRPVHMAAAVKAGKHVFAEKPVCVDPAGYRSVLESAQLAKRNRTAIVTGTQYRRQPSYVEAIKRIHDGAIGDITSGISYYCSSGIWYRDRKPDITDLQYQLYNWYHFVWLCGDQICEQAVHNLDAVNWALKDRTPVKAYGSGGQMTRPADSEIYDHVSIDYEYPGGVNISFKCRQIPGSDVKVINTFVGTRGVAYVNPDNSLIMDHDGNEVFRTGERGNNPYVQEHADLIDSIRKGVPIVEVEATANSSLTAVLGRFAAYSGKEVTYEFTRQSKLNLMPDNLTWDTPAPQHGLVIPGRYELI